MSEAELADRAAVVEAELVVAEAARDVLVDDLCALVREWARVRIRQVALGALLEQRRRNGVLMAASTEFTTSWREFNANGVSNAQLGDLEQWTDAEVASVKELVAAALASVDADSRDHDLPYRVSLEVDRDHLVPALTFSMTAEGG